METEKDLLREAGLNAIRFHSESIKLLQDIINLAYQNFDILDKKGNEIENLKTDEFIVKNVSRKSNTLFAHYESLKVCYDQMKLPQTP